MSAIVVAVAVVLSGLGLPSSSSSHTLATAFQFQFQFQFQSSSPKLQTQTSNVRSQRSTPKNAINSLRRLEATQQRDETASTTSAEARVEEENAAVNGDGASSSSSSSSIATAPPSDVEGLPWWWDLIWELDVMKTGEPGQDIVFGDIANVLRSNIEQIYGGFPSRDGCPLAEGAITDIAEGTYVGCGSNTTDTAFANERLFVWYRLIRSLSSPSLSSSQAPCSLDCNGTFKIMAVRTSCVLVPKVSWSYRTPFKPNMYSEKPVHNTTRDC